ncbi:hypothetical protein [Microbacterium sp. nov. GSS16]|uniref:hypothetical protein n=1 Tax=Microbacterium sp. nov. GSS16 TaxID=3019890 RepID=UPI0023054BEA|nr:hypothetical protein [Microbacterium sp. nov. GSS16]WCD91500.1 hypothetical protein PGB26_07240 [Microbacterium sp. nov. GSS16]
MGRPSALREANVDRRSQWASIREAAKRGPLQSLTERELALDEHPMTVYPWRLQRRVRAWVRFGPESIRVDAKIVRSTPLAAGIEFRCEDQTLRCWVWGNAVQLDD